MDDRTVTKAGQFESLVFGKDISVYAVGNGILFVFGVLLALIIPKYLTLEGYGYWQIFTLYCGYVGILHLGFPEAILVRWAGKDLSQVGSEIKPAFRFLIIEQVAVILPLGLITFFLLPSPFQWIGLMICISAFIINLAYLFIITTQAIRKFRLLTVLYVGRGFAFLVITSLLFATGHIEYQYIIVAFMTAYLLLLIVFAIRYQRYLSGKDAQIISLFSYGNSNIKTGIFIYLGHIIFAIFLTVDRLLVTAFFTIEQFAIYAFAAAVINFVFVFIRAIAEVLFPHLSMAATQQRTKAFLLGKRVLIFCWAIFLCAYFPLAALIEFYLPQYTPSLPLIKIMLGTLGFSSMILILHVNYYRLYQKQRQYFIVGITALALAVLLVLLGIKMIGSLESVAIAILISFVAWWIINELSLKLVTGESGGKIVKDLMIMGCYFAGFWFSFFLSDRIFVEMVLYLVFFLIIGLIFLRTDLRDLLFIVRKSLNKSS